LYLAHSISFCLYIYLSLPPSLFVYVYLNNPSLYLSLFSLSLIFSVCFYVSLST
jgi:hypothetical protein